jgi:hypothetical protein
MNQFTFCTKQAAKVLEQPEVVFQIIATASLFLGINSSEGNDSAMELISSQESIPSK